MPQKIKMNIIQKFFVSIFRRIFKKRQPAEQSAGLPLSSTSFSSSSSSSSLAREETKLDENCKIISNQQLSARMSPLNTCSHNNSGIYNDLVISLRDWRNYLRNFNIYHYTSLEKANQIRNDQFLKPKKARIPPYKKAVYLTMLSPLENDNVLLENNYKGNIKYRKKLECAFAFNNNSLNASRSILREDDRRDVWMVEDHIYLKDHEYING